MNVGIVIQGPIYDAKSIIKSYRNIDKNSIVVSTWDNQPESEIKLLTDNGFNVVKTIPPKYSGYNNCNLQIVSTIKGIKYLNNKFTHILKMRTDLLPNNINKFIKILSKNPHKLNFFCWVDRYDVEYLTDFYLFGEYDKMYKFWNVFQNNETYFPEQFLFHKYFNDDKPKYKSYTNDIRSNLVDLYRGKIKLIWSKPDRDGIDQVDIYYHCSDVLKI